MAFVIGHSQTKYLSEYLCKGSYSVFSYPGYRTSQLLSEQVIFEVAPFFSVVVVVVGANDIFTKTPSRIANDIEILCNEIHSHSPCATILLSEILPRAHNRFNGCGLRHGFLDRWNYDAGKVNQLLRAFACREPLVRIIEQPDFHTLFGTNVNLLSKDGLHLSHDGTTTFASGIELAVRSLTSAIPCKPPAPLPTSTQSTQAPVYGPKRYSDIVARKPARPTPSPHITSSRSVTSRTNVSTRKPARPTPSPQTTSSRSVTSRTNVSTRKPARPTPSPQTTSSRSVTSRTNVSTRKPARPTSKKSSISNMSELDEIVRWIQDPAQIPDNRNRKSGGGGVSVLFSNQKTTLSAERAEEVMSSCESGANSEYISTGMPDNVNDGDIFVIDMSILINKKDVRIDRYMWINDGRKKIPNKKPTMSKSFFKIRLEKNEHSRPSVI